MIERKKALKDGTVETFRPHKYPNGKYRVEIEVADLKEVEKLANSGCAVRMKGDKSGQVNLVRLES